jgi:hypothetical protein
MSLEQKANEIFSRYIDDYNCSKYLIVVDSERVNLNQDFNNFDELLVFEKLYYSKNLPKIHTGKKRLREKLKKLEIGINDLLISPPLFDLANIIIYDFFKSRNGKTLIYSFNGVTLNKKNFRFNINKTLLYSLNTLLINKKITLVYNIKNTPHKYPFMKVDSDYFIDFGVSRSEKKFIKTKKMYKVKIIESLKTESNEVIILINTNKIKELTGLTIEEYMNKVNLLIKKLDKSFDVKIKDHPSSKFSSHYLIEHLKIREANVIEKKISFENYLESNTPQYILSSASNSMLFAVAFGVNCYSIAEFFDENNPDVFSKIFGFSIYRGNISNNTNLDIGSNIKMKSIFNEILAELN